MSDIPTKYLRQIRRYEPVTTEGICLYPIRVDEYEEFAIARPAVEFMQQSLPVALMTVPLLQAFYRIDEECRRNGENTTGLFSRALLFLALALRLGEDMRPEDRLRLLRPMVDLNDPLKLKALVFSPDGEEQCLITPATFQRIRPILAAQNGLTLPDDDANPALVQAEEEIRRQKAPQLDTSMEALVASVAVFSGVDESEIYGWPIARLLGRQRAIHRALDYAICGIGEAQGTKWKKGNPSPSPFFDRKKEDSAAKVPLSEFAGGAAMSAMREAQA